MNSLEQKALLEQHGFDTSKFMLGSLCKRGHDFEGTGYSLKRNPKSYCVACGKMKSKNPGVGRGNNPNSHINKRTSLEHKLLTCIDYPKELKNDCWIWKGSLTTLGYGRVWERDKHYLAHRVSYEYHKGKIPKGLVVRHSCHNPRCVNPNHLIVGTQADNSMDMLLANRCKSCKLNEEEVRSIRLEYKTGKYTLKKLAIKYGLKSETNISDIVNRKIWKHVD